MKTVKFIDLCKGAMFIMFGISAISLVAIFGFASITNNSVRADSPNITNATGKYLMSESGFVHNGRPIYHVLVWDTETGKSKLYGLNPTTVKLVSTDYQIPASPLY